MSIRPWAIGRRIQYGVGFFLFWLMIGTGIYYLNFHQPPNCFDGIRNGEERGVDCGGGCVLICATDVIPPKISWAESFKIGPGQYNVVAFVENLNQTAGTPELKYTFELLNEGEVVATRSGTTVLPPNYLYPIFEGRVYTDASQPVTDTRITLEPAKEWRPASVERDQFRALDINLTNTDTRPRLYVEMENTSLIDAENVEVVAVIYNEGGVPATASQTFIEQIPARSTEDIVFTWPNSIARTVRSCEVPTDVAMAVDLSGSMNNDGGEPPQPITDALKAAAQFVETLRKDDQIAVITFATEAETETELTAIQSEVTNQILNLQINPTEETGFTNTVAALTAAQAELNSARHNPDARRVLVLLTDGLPTTKGDADVVSEAISKAQALREDEIEIYAIGLGENVNQDFIASISSNRSNAYLAPTTADLQTIYSEITSSLCEVGPTKTDTIAKARVNFESDR